jgi:hypothetical protein
MNACEHEAVTVKPKVTLIIKSAVIQWLVYVCVWTSTERNHDFTEKIH